ncbi:MAG: hypothetical protein RL885_13985 [Planctomycetota bacterium]
MIRQHESIWMAFLLLAGLTIPCGSSRADFNADGGDLLVPQATSYTQEYGRVACNPTGTLFGVAFESVVNHDVYVRLFDHAGAALTGDILVNPTLNNYIQDEPTIAFDAAGNFIVAWSDRSAFDGDSMGIFARIFDSSGNPKGPEFQVNLNGAESQWEPNATALPDGAWAVTWSGTFSGDAFFRIFEPNGTPRTGDVQANTLTNNAQIDTEIAANRSGELFLVYIDYGGHGGVGTATNVYGRRFDSQGQALDPAEFLVNENTLSGDQRDVRVGADGFNGWVLVWEDRLNDGSGKGIYGRLYRDSTPQGPEFLVNQTTEDDQALPALAVDWMGNFVVAYESWQSGDSDILARRFDASGQPLGAEFLVNQSPTGSQINPSVAVDWAGQDFVFVYTGPGAASQDVFVRRFRNEPVKVVGPPALGASFQLALDLPSGAGLTYLVVGSLQTSPGIPLPDGRHLDLANDVLLASTLAFPNSGPYFFNFQGTLDAAGQATATVAIPNDPRLSGLNAYFAVITLDSGSPGLFSALRHVTESILVSIP